jgi:hypothetical protein
LQALCLARLSQDKVQFTSDVLMLFGIKISVASQSVIYRLVGQSSIPSRIGNILFATVSGIAQGHT